ncbi:MAG: DUF1080 domain-containing protein [Tannerella sp.]|nr:DUF1080 domain-containing protein [Tannerella sp.]
MKDKRIYLILSILTAMTMILSGSMALRNQDYRDSDIASFQDTRDLPVDSAEWQSLFDGKTLTGWETVRYGGDGKPSVRRGAMVIPRATTGTMTGLRWVGDPLPVNNYEVYYEARRVAGSDIFGALTFPYGDTSASLIFAGWGGVVNGLSSIGGLDASENETCQRFSYDDNVWYEVKLRVTTDSIRASVGGDTIVKIATAGKDIHLRADYLDTGFTLWTYNSTGEIRNLRISRIE